MTLPGAPVTHPRSASAQAADAVNATPADRDRWVDALRVGSLLVVVLGHWFMVVLTPDGRITNALSIAPALQPVTWLLQVMPLFFLVGGVAHAHALDSLARRHPETEGRYATFVRARAQRLLRPTLAFLLVWVALGAGAHLAGVTERGDGQGELARNALVMVPQLLWFVGIYLGVCACAPAMRRLHDRWGLWAVAMLVGLAVAVDLARFAADLSVIGNLNFAFVWLALHQLGFAWRDGLLTTRRGWLMAVGGFGAMGLAVAVGPYPVSMVGLPGEAVSNMAPPTVALLAQGIGICGLAVVLRPVMNRVLTRPRVWRVLVLSGAFAMTAFLWHLTALMLVLVGLRSLGVEQPEVASGLWWLTRPLLFAVLAVVTAGLVALFVRFDRPPRGEHASRADTRADGRAGTRGEVAVRGADPMAAVAALIIFFGVLIVSVVGVDVLGSRPVFFLVGDVTPLVGFGVLAVGLALLASTRPLPSHLGDVEPPRTGQPWRP